MRSYIRVLVLLALLSALSILGFLLASKNNFRLGFPLDDAWIHQTYARNFALSGKWTFQPGVPSAGSTSPLWSGILSIGYLGGLGSYIWTFLLGWLFLFSIASIGLYYVHNIFRIEIKYALWVGIFLGLEWHLVWAAASGMETLLFALITISTFFLLAKYPANWFFIGILIGFCLWCRPDGITLLGPAFLCPLFLHLDWRKRAAAIIKIGIGFSLLFIPYIAFNLQLSGSIWPNTLAAKQAEYGIGRHVSFFLRWLRLSSLPLIGAGVLLFPGFILFIVKVIRVRRWSYMLGIIWFLGYITLYAWRLPVTYQHGRYIIPAMPIYFIYSIVGLFSILKDISSISWQRVLQRVYIISLGLVTICFWFIGANAYAKDVAIIESEMVETAHWVAKNTNSESLIAAHDIGALGFFSERRLLDLAGLISPEVIPFLRDETRLKKYLDEHKVDLLITFPGWYPNLVKYGRLIYCTKGTFSPLYGGENMSIYRWDPP